MPQKQAENFYLSYLEGPSGLPPFLFFHCYKVSVKQSRCHQNQIIISRDAESSHIFVFINACPETR